MNRYNLHVRRNGEWSVMKLLAKTKELDMSYLHNDSTADNTLQPTRYSEIEPLIC